MKLIELLQDTVRMAERFGADYEVFAVCSSSGVSYNVNGLHISVVSEYDDVGPVSEMGNGAPYIRLSLD